jgi:hypothetical protein
LRERAARVAELPCAAAAPDRALLARVPAGGASAGRMPSEGLTDVAPVEPAAGLGDAALVVGAAGDAVVDVPLAEGALVDEARVEGVA